MDYLIFHEYITKNIGLRIKTFEALVTLVGQIINSIHTPQPSFMNVTFN